MPFFARPSLVHSFLLNLYQPCALGLNRSATNCGWPKGWLNYDAIMQHFFGCKPFTTGNPPLDFWEATNRITFVSVHFGRFLWGPSCMPTGSLALRSGAAVSFGHCLAWMLQVHCHELVPLPGRKFLVLWRHPHGAETQVRVFQQLPLWSAAPVVH